MKKILFVLFSLFLAVTTLSAQSPLTSEKNPEGPMTINWKAGKLAIGDYVIDKNQTHLYLSPEAETLYQRGDKLSSAGDLMMAGGAGFALGWFVSDLIIGNKGGEKRNSTPVYIGCAVVAAIGVPLHFIGVGQIKKAVADYNARNGFASRAPELDFGLQSNGIGLAFRF